MWNNLSTAERVLLLQRRRRRLTQRRYRKKIEGKAALLAKQIDALQEEVQELQKKAKVVASTPNREPKTPWNLLVEYFSLFRRGLDTQALSDDHVQKNFLQTVMTSDVASNHGFGVEVMLEDWRSLSQRHPNLEIVLVKLCNRSEHVIIADVKGYTTITESMLRSALSNSHASDTEETWPPFASRLLGQRLVIPGSVLFEWGETESRFASVLYEVDMLSALVARLGDVEEASVVMDSALSIAG
ncbi:uncharacterized protein IUM83_19529 [Phytophthora cinnamomi]|uniref:uncharacterized protein n=1 Tax=Phytophthora cinnamomi TaxID=4785 RepID=UPI003559987F|nr:hypothetical protein IUM83_19529 [Phytophthora cinnamomi]